MASAHGDLRFDSVLGGRPAGVRTALIVFPVVAVMVALAVLAGVAISRMSGLQAQVRIAQRQAEEANKAVDERDRQLRDARAETAALATPGQGAAVLRATAAASGASGIVLAHPAQHVLAVHVFGLRPPGRDQEYRLIVTDGVGRESLLGALRLDDRGASFLLARGVPEGIASVEVASVPEAASADRGATGSAPGGAAAGPPAEREPVLTGALPRPGEAGVVLAAGPSESRTPRAHDRAARGRRTPAR